MTAINIRHANHLAITDSGRVHLASDANVRPYHVLACNGRAVDAAGTSLGSTAVTCVACRKGEAAGRIVVGDDQTCCPECRHPVSSHFARRPADAPGEQNGSCGPAPATTGCNDCRHTV